jgi:hypothetical protein
MQRHAAVVERPPLGGHELVQAGEADDADAEPPRRVR